MESRPPASILVAIASATVLGLVEIAALGWYFFRASSAGEPVVRPSVNAIFGIVLLALFVERALRRRRRVRAPAIALALTLAFAFAVLTVIVAVSPGIADRWFWVAVTATFTLLPSLIAAPLLRASARTWLSE